MGTCGIPQNNNLETEINLKINDRDYKITCTQISSQPSKRLDENDQNIKEGRDSNKNFYKKVKDKSINLQIQGNNDNDNDNDNDSKNNESKNNKESKFINIINAPKINLKSIDDNNIDLKYDSNKDYYIVCLRCKCRNPHIEKINFDQNLYDINVSYICACFQENIKFQSEYLELLIDLNKPLNLCPVHSMNTLKFYCNICKKFFCEKCKRDSDEHNKYFINFDIIMSEDIVKNINNNYLPRIKEKKKELIYKKIINDYLNNIKKIDIPKYHLKISKNLHDKVTAIILLKSGSIATGSYDQTICIWNIENLSIVQKIKVFGKVFALLEFESNMLLSSIENTICLWDINPDKNECIYRFIGHELWVNCLVKYDDKTFVSASNDYKIIIWDYAKKQKIRKFEVHKNCIFSLIKLNDGNLCSGGADFVIKILDWKQKKLIRILKGHEDSVKCLCQMNNETLLSGSNDRTIKVWKKNECIFTLKKHSHLVRVLIKINDNYFASGSFDNKIIIWNIKTFLSQQTLDEHSSEILCLLKLDNDDLVSCSSDKAMKIWGKK